MSGVPVHELTTNVKSTPLSVLYCLLCDNNMTMVTSFNGLIKTVVKFWIWNQINLFTHFFLKMKNAVQIRTSIFQKHQFAIWHCLCSLIFLSYDSLILTSNMTILVLNFNKYATCLWHTPIPLKFCCTSVENQWTKHCSTQDIICKYLH